MSLQNLVGVSLDANAPSRDTVTRLRSAAKRQIWVANWLKTHKPELP